MSKPGQRADVNSFIQGLITEASALNFPANASADEVNFELNRDGSRQRRLGMDFEEGFQLHDTGMSVGDASANAFNTFRWDAVNGNPNLNFQVVQFGNSLMFFNRDVLSISGSGFIAQINVGLFESDVIYSFAAVEGILAVAGGASTIAVITYDTSDPTLFPIDYQTLRTRDVWGLEEQFPGYENDPSFRSPNLGGIHYYNLQNQSWGIPRKRSDGVLLDPVDIYQTALGVYPSNSEQVWTGLQFQSVATGQTPFERVFTNLYTETLGAKTSSAKGYYTIDVLNRGSSRQSEFDGNKTKYPQLSFPATIPTDVTTGGPSCVEAYAGRIFFAGFNGELVGGDVRSPILTNYIFFSQLVKNRQDIKKCYQEGDPTSRDSSDVVDTDGGFLRVSGAKNIIALRNLGTHLVVFATNGVWTVTGGQVDSGFGATNYKVSKVSTFGALAPKTIVTEGATCFYWASDGIYVVGKNQFGDLEVKSLTLTTIQTLYREIPNQSKLNAFGEYDEISKKVRWVYKTGDLFTVGSRTLELIFDSQVGSFTQNEVFDTAARTTEIVGVFQSNITLTAPGTQAVFAGTDQVLSNADDVVLPSVNQVSNVQTLRYITLVTAGSMTFSFYNNTEFRDWSKVDGLGVDAKAHCLTGTQTAGDSGMEKQIPYLIMHFKRTEQGVDESFQPLHQSGCLMRGQWAFANTAAANKWTPLVQTYRYRKALLVTGLSDPYDSGFDIVTTKNKLRGRGKAFALYFETEPFKDCHIIGWNITMNGNQVT